MRVRCVGLLGPGSEETKRQLERIDFEKLALDLMGSKEGREEEPLTESELFELISDLLGIPHSKVQMLDSRQLVAYSAIAVLCDLGIVEEIVGRVMLRRWVKYRILKEKGIEKD